MKGSEALLIVVVALALISVISLMAWMNSVSNPNDIESLPEKTGEFLIDFTIGEIVAVIVTIVAIVVIGLLVALGVLKRG